jgi:hypothetical protein
MQRLARIEVAFDSANTAGAIWAFSGKSGGDMPMPGELSTGRAVAETTFSRKQAPAHAFPVDIGPCPSRKLLLYVWLY